MSLKQTRFSRTKKTREDGNADECYVPRRPILYSSDDVQRMAVERSRAKLIRQLVSQPPESFREFSSYYSGHNQLIDPVYSATSHTVNDREFTYASVTPTYPTIVNNVRWNPASTEASPIYNYDSNEIQNSGELSNFNCRCNKCRSQYCRGQTRLLRDNIKKFTDSTTMTPKLSDACCGSCTPVTTCRKTSDVSVSSSDIAVKEDHCPMAGVSQVYINCDPVPILKKKKCESLKEGRKLEVDDGYRAHTEKKCRIANDYQEAVRDTEENVYEERVNSKPLRSFPKVVRNKPQNLFEEPRKNIYNEGISDFTINLLPAALIYPEIPQTSKKITPSNSSFLRKGSQRRDGVPFSHNIESKYHNTCKTPQTKSYYGSNNNTEREIYTKKFKKTYASKLVPFYNAEPPKFPRRVLISEKDIDSYVGGQFTK